jgi:DNA-binding MarR family transcriptional regulator
MVGAAVWGAEIRFSCCEAVFVEQSAESISSLDQQHMLDRLHESGFGDFDAAYLTVFQYPGPQGTRPSELAARLRISKQALNYLLGGLERLGYLERRADSDDLRSKRIALTPRGIAAVGVIREAVGEVESAWAEQLGAERFDELRNVLLELNQMG